MWQDIVIPVLAAVVGYVTRHLFKPPWSPSPPPAPAPGPSPGPSPAVPAPLPAPSPSPSLIDAALSALIAALKARFPNLPIQEDGQGKVHMFADAAGGDAQSYDAGPYVVDVSYRVRLKETVHV